MTFKNLEIIQPILDAIKSEGYETPSPIQVEALPILLSGRDLLASAQTGTGKTAAFAIPIIQSIYQNKNDEDKRLLKALVLAPTRELAEQIKTSFKTYSGKLNIKVGAIYGGASQKAQEGMLSRGIDILVATPGRLIDLIKQKIVKLGDVQYFVLDEADTLLDMGFIKDVKHIKGFIPKTRQTMMFSATISKEVTSLASELLNDPLQLEMAPPEMMLDKINHSLFFVDKKEKKELLLDLLVNPALESVLVFTRTKHGANKLVNYLLEYGLKADAIHGNKSQSKRQIALNDFKERKTRLLVATDIAARGIDIDDLTHVINFDLPDSPETYVHRIGRTGRRGLKGEAYTFCSNDERGLLKAVEKHTGLKLKVLKMEPVSEDSKFKKVVEGFSPQQDDLGDRASGKGKDKKPSRTRTKRLESNSPRDFGKKRSNSSNNKKMYQNKANEAFIEVEEKEKKRRRAYKKANPSEKVGDSQPTLDDYKKRNTIREGEQGGYNKTNSNKSRGFKSRDGEKARSDNFRSMTDRPSGRYKRKDENATGETRSYSKSSSRPYASKSQDGGTNTPYQDRRSRSNKNTERSGEFSGRPGSKNRPTRASKGPGFVDVGEKELYGKKAKSYSKSYGKTSKPSRSYANKPTGAKKSFDRSGKPSGRFHNKNRGN